MGRFDRGMATAAFAGLLASCGGSTPTPTPSPTPTATATPTPTPTPTPTFAYSTITGLTAETTFATACEVYGVQSNGVPFFTGPQTKVLEGGNITFAPATSIWTIALIEALGATAFTPANQVSGPANSLVYSLPGATPVPQRLTVITPVVNGTPAVYTRGASYLVIGSTGVLQEALCAFGIPTVAADMRTVTAAFSFPDIALGGFVYDESPTGGTRTVSTITGGTGTITGTPGTETMSFSLTATARRPDNSEFTIGPITGNIGLQINDTRAGYNGFLVPPGTPGSPVYRINGGFFGPQGRETGFSISGAFDLNNNGSNERYVLIGGTARR